MRIVSATHQNLKAMVEDSRFRQDLFYRLNVIELKMPALRERREDILPLTAALVERLAEQSGQTSPQLAPSAEKALKAYGFPGNVRELENILERAMALCSGDAIQEEDLLLEPPSEGRSDIGEDGVAASDVGLQEYLDKVERHAILDALAKTDGNRTAAARLLRVTFRSLRYRMERLGMKE